jgi:hypothetical protein
VKQKIKLGLAGTALVAAGLLGGLLVSQPLQANSTATPGSVEDPVVTKSYVDQQIAKLGGGSGGNTGNTGGSGSAQVSLEVVTVPADKKLIVPAGTEVVVRSGKAVAYSNDPSGISDVTDGVDILNGKPVPTNHLLWFPRDGRGIMPAPGATGSLIVAVKGSYSLQ